MVEQIKNVTTSVNSLNCDVNKSGENKEVSVFSNNSTGEQLSSVELAKKLAKTIYGLGGNENLEFYVDLINEHNFRDVMIEYKKISQEKKDNLNSILKILPFNTDKITSRFAPEESLLTAIYNETGLSDNKKEYMMHKLIIELSKKENADLADEIVQKELEEYLKKTSKVFVEDVLEDIRNNKDCTSKVLVDILRKIRRENLGQAVNPSSSANGKIDNEFHQGVFGDCWLIAGLSAITSKEGGVDYLNSLLNYDEKTGDVTVNLRGVGKEIVVTKAEIENLTHLSKGDGDINAIEIAVDKYFKEEAYNDPQKALGNLDENNDVVDIYGDWSYKLFNILLGNGEDIENPAEKVLNGEIDLNDKTKCFVFSTPSARLLHDIESFPYYSSVARNHAYTVLSADDKYIYLKDPEDNKVLNLARSELKVDEIRLEVADLGKIN